MPKDGQKTDKISDVAELQRKLRDANSLIATLSGIKKSNVYFLGMGEFKLDERKYLPAGGTVSFELDDDGFERIQVSFDKNKVLNIQATRAICVSLNAGNDIQITLKP